MYRCVLQLSIEVVYYHQYSFIFLILLEIFCAKISLRNIFSAGQEEMHISLLEELNRSLSSLSAEDIAEQISLHRKLQQTLAFDDDDDSGELDAAQSRT